jgi:hypothetical protein
MLEGFNGRCRDAARLFRIVETRFRISHRKARERENGTGNASLTLWRPDLTNFVPVSAESRGGEFTRNYAGDD